MLNISEEERSILLNQFKQLSFVRCLCFASCPCLLRFYVSVTQKGELSEERTDLKSKFWTFLLWTKCLLEDRCWKIRFSGCSRIKGNEEQMSGDLLPPLFSLWVTSLQNKTSPKKKKVTMLPGSVVKGRTQESKKSNSKETFMCGN